MSNSGHPFLEYCRDRLKQFTGQRRLLFVSAAGFIDPVDYYSTVCDALQPAGLTIDHLELDRDPEGQIANAEAFLVGGGNTFKLVKMLHDGRYMELIRKKIQSGALYLGWSAGANLACPQVLTSNDWNVVSGVNFEGLNLVPFNINPHYLESDPNSAPYGETRDQRIGEYHQVHSNSVLGIEEQTLVEVIDGAVTVRGEGRVRHFRPEQAPVDYREGQMIDDVSQS